MKSSLYKLNINKDLNKYSNLIEIYQHRKIITGISVLIFPIENSVCNSAHLFHFISINSSGFLYTQRCINFKVEKFLCRVISVHGSTGKQLTPGIYTPTNHNYSWCGGTHSGWQHGRHALTANICTSEVPLSKTRWIPISYSDLNLLLTFTLPISLWKGQQKTNVSFGDQLRITLKSVARKLPANSFIVCLLPSKISRCNHILYEVWMA